MDMCVYVCVCVFVCVSVYADISWSTRPILTTGIIFLDFVYTIMVNILFCQSRFFFFFITIFQFWIFLFSIFQYLERILFIYYEFSVCRIKIDTIEKKEADSCISS